VASDRAVGVPGSNIRARLPVSVSEIGLGCSGFWGDRLFSDKQAIRIVLEDHAHGVNFFDTGSNYSNFNAEPRLGRAVKAIRANNPRERLVISTKAGSLSGYAPTVQDDDLRFTDFSPEAITQSCLKSIANLNCDYLDVFQLHGFRPDMLNQAMFDCLLSLKERGLIRSIGVNTHFRNDLLQIMKHPDVFDMVLIDCNVLQLDRFEIIEKLVQAGIGVVVGTVLAQGHLVRRKIGSVRNGSYFWYLARTLIKPTTKDFAKSSDDMRKVLGSMKEMSAAQAAFAYLLQNPNISCCLFGTTKAANLEEIIAASGKQLSEDSRRAIERAYSMNRSLSR
jgi:aryl-alcohol dehydrogenase-like predicted oxidoreductase